MFLTQLKLASGAWPPSSVLPPSYRQTDCGGEGARRPVWSGVWGAELRLVAQHQTGNSSQGLEPASLSEQLYPGDPMGSVLPKVQESQRGDPAGADSPTNRSQKRGWQKLCSTHTQGADTSLQRLVGAPKHKAAGLCPLSLPPFLADWEADVASILAPR